MARRSKQSSFCLIGCCKPGTKTLRKSSSIANTTVPCAKIASCSACREFADRVRITGRSLQLEPMNSYERRLVHNAFKDDPDVATWSPSDSARIKQITLLKRQPKRETAHSARRLPSCRILLQPLVSAELGSRILRRRPQARRLQSLARATSVPLPARTSGRQRNFLQNRIRFFLNGVGNDFAKHGREFKSVSAITRSDY